MRRAGVKADLPAIARSPRGWRRAGSPPPERLEREDREGRANVGDRVEVALHDPADRVEVFEVQLDEEVVFPAHAVRLREGLDLPDAIRDLRDVARIGLDEHEDGAHGTKIASLDVAPRRGRLRLPRHPLSRIVEEGL